MSVNSEPGARGQDLRSASACAEPSAAGRREQHLAARMHQHRGEIPGRDARLGGEMLRGEEAQAGAFALDHAVDILRHDRHGEEAHAVGARHAKGRSRVIR